MKHGFICYFGDLFLRLLASVTIQASISTSISISMIPFLFLQVLVLFWTYVSIFNSILTFTFTLIFHLSFAFIFMLVFISTYVWISIFLFISQASTSNLISTFLPTFISISILYHDFIFYFQWDPIYFPRSFAGLSLVL